MQTNQEGGPVDSFEYYAKVTQSITDEVARTEALRAAEQASVDARNVAVQSALDERNAASEAAWYRSVATAAALMRGLFDDAPSVNAEGLYARADPFPTSNGLAPLQAVPLCELCAVLAREIA